MPPVYLKDVGGRVLVLAKPHTLSAQLREIAALADPRQDMFAECANYTPGLSKAVQS